MERNTSSKVSRMDLGLPGRLITSASPRMPTIEKAKVGGKGWRQGRVMVGVWVRNCSWVHDQGLASGAYVKRDLRLAGECINRWSRWWFVPGFGIEGGLMIRALPRVPTFAGSAVGGGGVIVSTVLFARWWFGPGCRAGASACGVRE